MGDRAERERQAILRAARDYQTLRRNAEDAGLPELALVAVNVTHDDIDLDGEAFRQVLAALAEDDAQGWCRFRSAVVWAQARAWPDFDEAGPPIHGEWTAGPTASCRLRLLSGEWPARARIWTFRERLLAQEDPLAPGEICALREERRTLARAAPDGVTGLAYHVFWGAEPHEDVHALRRRFDRFVGFLKE